MQRQVKLKHKSHSKVLRHRPAMPAKDIVSLEVYIHELAVKGDRRGLRDALYLYLRTRGVKCV